MRTYLMTLLLAGLTGLTTAAAQEDATENAGDREAVRRACLDYVEGVYEVKPELIERGVHKDLKKYGYWKRDAESDYQPTPMSFEQLHRLAATFNKDGHVPADAPKEIVIFDVLDKTASAKLTAHWGVDYFHLVKEDGQWKILQVLWQSPPDSTASGQR